MRAARLFLESVAACGLLASVDRVTVDLYGSLALTGQGHGTDRAVVWGLMGSLPETMDPAVGATAFERLLEESRIDLLGRHPVAFDVVTDIKYQRETFLEDHPNGLRFTARSRDRILAEKSYFSIGGGQVVSAGQDADRLERKSGDRYPYPFHSAVDLLTYCTQATLSVAEVVAANERIATAPTTLERRLDDLRATMMASIDRGLTAGGLLPGPLKVRRRAASLMARADGKKGLNSRRPHEYMEIVSAYAIAVNEENAAGGRIVTAPTNGAAGIVPAVLRYLEETGGGVDPDPHRPYLLTAAAIGMLFKRNASISGAEMGCQGEVGVASSMAAAGLTAALGGTPQQVENAAEIAMEHHLGMTCDPVGGLVQIPCIERNAMGAIKAINAASLALNGDGFHVVSLDTVIETMRQTGIDMQSKYKETSQGGLAVNVVAC